MKDEEKTKAELIEELTLLRERVAGFEGVESEQQKRAEEALQKSETNYRRLVEINPHIIYQLDTDGIITFISEGIRALTDYEADELVGKSFSDLVHEDDLDKMARVNERRSGKRGTRSLELKLVRGDTSTHVETRWVGVNATGVYEDGYVGDGRLESKGKATQFIGTHGTITDITERKQAEKTLRETTRMQEAFRRSTETMLSSLDFDEVLDTLGVEIVKTGIFRGLSISVPDYRNGVIRRVRSMARDSMGDTPIYSDSVDAERDLDSDDILAETVRRKETQIAAGDDPRFAQDSLVDRGSLYYFIPLKDDDQVLAVIATSSMADEKERVLSILDAMKPLLNQVAIAIKNASLFSERKQADDALHREHRLHDAETAVRVTIASMDQPEDLCKVVEEIERQLRLLGLDHDSCSIQIVNQEGTEFVSVGTKIPLAWYDEIMNFVATGSRRASRSNAEDYPWVIEVWRDGEPRYDPCAELHGAGTAFTDLSLIDVPFSHGTLAINKSQAHSFDEEAISLLARFAHVLSEGFQRFSDIMERRKAEEALLQSSRLIALGEMAAGLAHELNQPLTVITALAEGIQLRLERNIDVPLERLVKWGQDTLESVARMSALIEHLRVFSRDRPEKPVDEVALSDVVRSALSMTEVQLQSRGIEVSLELSDDLPAILADPYRLEQVVLNLIGNARDALEEEWRQTPDSYRSDWAMRLTVRTRREDDDVLIELEDNGSGMDDETRQRLFEPFFTTKGPDRGTGLGLSISHAIVRDHGGGIECESQRGEGTRFRVRLPIPR